MEKIYLFGKKKSQGSFDDFFNQDKYTSIEEAWGANDFVKGDYVKDESGTIHIELSHTKTPDTKKYHRLNVQNCPFEIDVFDDNAAVELAQTLLT